jgi:hypothetical protein
MLHASTDEKDAQIHTLQERLNQMIKETLTAKLKATRAIEAVNTYEATAKAAEDRAETAEKKLAAGLRIEEPMQLTRIRRASYLLHGRDPEGWQNSMMMLAPVSRVRRRSPAPASPPVWIPAGVLLIRPRQEHGSRQRRIRRGSPAAASATERTEWLSGRVPGACCRRWGRSRRCTEWRRARRRPDPGIEGKAAPARASSACPLASARARL